MGSDASNHEDELPPELRELRDKDLSDFLPPSPFEVLQWGAEVLGDVVSAARGTPYEDRPSTAHARGEHQGWEDAEEGKLTPAPQYSGTLAAAYEAGYAEGKKQEEDSAARDAGRAAGYGDAVRHMESPTPPQYAANDAYVQAYQAAQQSYTAGEDAGRYDAAHNQESPVPSEYQNDPIYAAGYEAGSQGASQP
jgi:hypothetical protein